MKKATIFILILVFSNCITQSNGPFSGEDLNIAVTFLNSSGEDLLNPNTENHFDKKDIKVYYVVNGKKEIVPTHSKNGDSYINGFRLISPSVKAGKKYYELILWLNNDLSKDIKTTYLELDKNDIDTITHSNSSVEVSQKQVLQRRIKEVWYNGNRPTDGYTSTFKIVK